MKKLKILICGLTSDSSVFFISLYNYLNSIGHEVSFIIPEYSGAVCLIDKKIPFTRLKQIKNNCSLDKDDYFLLDKCLIYDLKQIGFHSGYLKVIKRKQVLKNSQKLYQAYKNYLKDKEVDLIIVWGGIRYYASIPAALAKINNISCIFIEKGLFPYTLQVDTKGVNASSNLKEEFALISSENELNSLEYFQSKLKQQWNFSQPLNNIRPIIKTKYLIANCDLLELFIKLFHKYIETKLLKNYRYKEFWKVTDPISDSEFIINDDYIFIPFQVLDDSQLLIHSSWIKDNVSLVRSVYESLTELGLKIKIVIKEHPREYLNNNYRKLLEKYDVKYSEVGTLDLIIKSKLIVTINSTVGFEAIVFNKPVICTGNAIYESIPFVHKVTNQRELTIKLKKVLNSNNSLLDSKVSNYISKVYNEMVKCNYILPDETGIYNLWNRILINNALL